MFRMPKFRIPNFRLMYKVQNYCQKFRIKSLLDSALILNFAKAQNKWKNFRIIAQSAEWESAEFQSAEF
jgi:hypothetical protein